MPIKLLLTGASGFLGGNFCKWYADQFEIHAVWHQNPVGLPGLPGLSAHQVDITDETALASLIETVKPDAVIHLAAYSDPNACQLHPEVSELVNIQASENMASICAGLKIPLLFASTDLVFDGKAAPYAEKDVPAPVSTYGLHKSIAEQAILDIYPNATVCRLPLMYGNSYNTANSFLQPMLQKLSNGEQVHLFTDEYRSVASARDVCKGLLMCLDNPGEIFHLGGNERISRYAFGKKTCEIFGYSESLLVKSKQKDVPMPAPRPKDVSLSSEKANNLGWMPGNIDTELLFIKENN